MTPEDQTEVLDNVRFVLTGPDGEVKLDETTHNLVTTIGREGIADQLLAAPSFSKPGWIAIGKSSTAAAEGNTVLGEELKRVALSEKTRAAKVVTLKAVFAAGEGTGPVKEAGIFDKVTEGEGHLYARATFGLIEKEALDSLTITWTVTVG